MSVVAQAPGAAGLTAGRRRGGIRDVYRVEIRKLMSQVIVRIAAGVCIVGPFVFTAIIKTQSTLPADTLFGRWLHTSGFAVPFVMLGFAAEGGFIVITALVAGDIFASEDRFGTWQTVLTRSCRRGDLFAGKALAAATYSLLMLLLLTLSSLAAGALLVGTQPVLGLSGTLLPTARAFGVVLASWATAVLPVLAFTSLGLLFSIATRSSVMGIVGPLAVGLLMTLFGVLGFRALMLTTPLESWHALLLTKPDLGPFLRGSAVSVGYIVVCLGLAWALLRRRDFAGAAPAGRQLSTEARVKVGLAAVLAVILLGVGSYRASPVTSASLERTVAATFGNLADVKAAVVGHPVKIRGHLLSAADARRLTTTCRRGGQIAPSHGPGADWVCVMTSGRPGPHQLVFGYDVDAKANGCFTAEAPSTIMGRVRIHDAFGHPVANPLLTFDGCLDTP